MCARPAWGLLVCLGVRALGGVPHAFRLENTAAQAGIGGRLLRQELDGDGRSLQPAVLHHRHRVQLLQEGRDARHARTVNRKLEKRAPLAAASREKWLAIRARHRAAELPATLLPSSWECSTRQHHVVEEAEEGREHKEQVRA